MLNVPKDLHRNSPIVAAAGYEHTGQILINLATQKLGFQTLEDVDVLDVGCGVRFIMTILNLNIPIKSYTGVESSQQIVKFLQDNVKDERFHFAHWNIYNRLYNTGGVELSAQDELPVDGLFDVIWLFSVFTHLIPKDTFALLQILRKKIRKNGKLFFSAKIDDHLDKFEDRDKNTPLLHAYYGKQYIELLIRSAGWKIDSFYENDPDNYIQSHYICSINED